VPEAFYLHADEPRLLDLSQTQRHARLCARTIHCLHSAYPAAAAFAHLHHPRHLLSIEPARHVRHRVRQQPFHVVPAGRRVSLGRSEAHGIGSDAAAACRETPIILGRCQRSLGTFTARGPGTRVGCRRVRLRIGPGRLARARDLSFAPATGPFKHPPALN
jgi:hypothetical protein